MLPLLVKSLSLSMDLRGHHYRCRVLPSCNFSLLLLWGGEKLITFTRGDSGKVKENKDSEQIVPADGRV